MKYIDNNHMDLEIQSYLFHIDDICNRNEHDCKFYKFISLAEKAENMAFGYKNDNIFSELASIINMLNELENHADILSELEY